MICLISLFVLFIFKVTFYFYSNKIICQKTFEEIKHKYEEPNINMYNSELHQNFAFPFGNVILILSKMFQLIIKIIEEKCKKPLNQEYTKFCVTFQIYQLKLYTSSFIEQTVVRYQFFIIIYNSEYIIHFISMNKTNLVIVKIVS